MQRFNDPGGAGGNVFQFEWGILTAALPIRPARGVAGLLTAPVSRVCSVRKRHAAP